MQLEGRTYSENVSSKSPFGFNGKVKDDEIYGEGNAYDFGARMYDPRIGRWMSVDPYAIKYPSISPYVFVANSPINAIDPDGKDVVFLIAKEGAGGMGHMAVLIQDEKGQWYYVTQGGNIPDNTSLPSVISGNFEGGYSITPLNTTDIEVAVEMAKGDVNNSPYTETLQLKTRKSQDKQIYKNTLKLENDFNTTGKEKYQLILNNCVDAVQKTIQRKTKINLPLDTDPRPNKYFEKLKGFVQKSNEKYDKTGGGMARNLSMELKPATFNLNTQPINGTPELNAIPKINE
jgi:RHS repeat-associated protein